MNVVLSQLFPTTGLSLAAAHISAESPSRKLPSTPIRVIFMSGDGSEVSCLELIGSRGLVETFAFLKF